MFSITRLTAVLLSVALAATFSTAQQGKPDAKPPAKPAAEAGKTSAFVVAKVGDKFEVLAKDEVDARKKKLAEEFAKSKEQWEKDKKAAETAKKPFNTPAPKETSFEVTPGEFATKDLAEAQVKKLQDAAKKPEPKKPDGGKKPEGGKSGHGK